MPERWRSELQRIDHLHPDDDLVERALGRPARPSSAPRPSARVAIIVVALLLPALAYGAFALMARRSAVEPGAGVDTSLSLEVSNGELLYTKRLDNGWHLFALDPTTGAERQITDGYRDYGSDWSPDGSRIVYDAEDSDGHAIWVAKADGSDAFKLVDDGSVPSWSPEGTKIVFARPDNELMVPIGEGSSASAFHLYVMDADGTNVRRLTDGQYADYSPTWSPDGTQIAFIRSGLGLFVMNADGSDQRAVLGPGAEIGPPDWSPEGTSIALTVNGVDGGRPGGVMLVSVNASDTTAIVPGTEADYPDYVSNPTWSPDGQWIAYIHGYPGEIVIVRPDGSDRRTLHVDPGTDSIEELAWGVAGATPG